MNKNFVEKFSTVENILFLIFLFAFPTAFYLYNYSACAALGLEREAFYFCLELVVLFGLLFIIFSCFPHHFVRPMLTKNIFFVFSIIFIRCQHIPDKKIVLPKPVISFLFHINEMSVISKTISLSFCPHKKSIIFENYQVLVSMLNVLSWFIRFMNVSFCHYLVCLFVNKVDSLKNKQ